MRDLINAFFEVAGGFITFLSVLVLLKHRQVRGVSLWPVVFFTSWGLWNLYYYPSLGQEWSAYGALFLCLVNATWLALALRFKMDEKDKEKLPATACMFEPGRETFIPLDDKTLADCQRRYHEQRRPKAD